MYLGNSSDLQGYGTPCDRYDCLKAPLSAIGRLPKQKSRQQHLLLADGVGPSVCFFGSRFNRFFLGTGLDVESSDAQSAPGVVNNWISYGAPPAASFAVIGLPHSIEFSMAKHEGQDDRPRLLFFAVKRYERTFFPGI
jgi:hypothetical protein